MKDCKNQKIFTVFWFYDVCVNTHSINGCVCLHFQPSFTLKAMNYNGRIYPNTMAPLKTVSHAGVLWQRCRSKWQPRNHLTICFSSRVRKKTLGDMSCIPTLTASEAFPFIGDWCSMECYAEIFLNEKGRYFIVPIEKYLSHTWHTCSVVLIENI